MSVAGTSPPSASALPLPDRLERERSRILTTILGAGTAVSGAMFVLVPFWREDFRASLIGYGLTFVLHLGHLALVRAGRPLLAARSFSIFFFVLVTGLFYAYGGVRGLGGFAYPLAVLFAGLTWSGAAAIGVALASSVTAIAMALAERHGLLTPLEPTISAGSASAVITAAVIMTAVMLFVALRTIRASTEEAVALERRRLELERDLAKAQRMESLGKLASGLAHDFNNLLTGIIGHAELLALRAGRDPEASRHAQLVLRASERAAELTRQLLTFSRRREPSIETVSVNGVVKHVAAFLEGSLDGRIALVSQLEAAPDWVEGDGAALESAVLNLAINARDAMPSGGTLRLRTERDQDRVCVLVSDSGTGIPAEIADKIFEPYFTTKEPGKGTGLGLAAVYGIAEEHGGSIEAQSREGSGATFVRTLPAAPGPPSCAQTSAPAGSDVHPLRVLAIDDEPAVLEAVTGLLEQLGHVALSSREPSESLEIVRRGEVDLVILDMMMPQISGTELLERIRRARPGIPVLVTSGYSPEPMNRWRSAEATLFLSKPYRGAELQAALSSLMARATGIPRPNEW